ncbi:MAG: 3-deoxy-8-phosphooctulonate synthase [Bacteroidia bacterium]|nr:MAG: 3-deoxy-8-phosphooctulonate synthase [Bacteroidia bacterium]
MSKKTVQIGDITCGADTLFLISGPCVIEEETVMMRTAEHLKKISEKYNLPVIYKSSFTKDNRSALNYYHGPGLEEGLKMLQKVKDNFGLPLVSDIHEAAHAAPAAEVLDMLQIPAYLCMQTSIVKAAADTGKPVNIKHGQFLAPENMSKPVRKMIDAGNEQVLLTERGYTFGYNDLIVDPRSFFEMQKTGFPVIFDITHSIRKYGIPSADPKGGAREYLPVLTRAGIAAGVDGVFLETHPKPEEALCDAASQLSLNDLEDFLKPIIEFHELEVKYRK